MAGAGTYCRQARSAHCSNYFAPVMPYRIGTIGSDIAAGRLLPRRTSITVMYVPSTAAQTTIRDAMPQPSSELKVNAQAELPAESDQLCGFKRACARSSSTTRGAYDPMTITAGPDDGAAPAAPATRLSARRCQIGAARRSRKSATHTYYLKTDVATNTYQLMHYDGYQTRPARRRQRRRARRSSTSAIRAAVLLPNKSLSDPGPWTTYGPKPPALGVDNANDTWPRRRKLRVQGRRRTGRRSRACPTSRHRHRAS